MPVTIDELIVNAVPAEPETRGEGQGRSQQQDAASQMRVVCHVRFLRMIVVSIDRNRCHTIKQLRLMYHPCP